MKAISLFTNCGAGDVGYATAGFRFKVISEIVKRRITVASLNLPGAITVLGDLRSTWPYVVDAFREFEGSESPILLSGCPPCQGMSSARSDRGKEADPDTGTRDGRNLLALPIAHVAKDLKPIFIVVENVPAFFRRKVRDPLTHEPVSAAKLLCDRLKGEYHVFALLVNLSEYGVPQNRNRAFLTFVQKNTAALDSLLCSGKAPFPIPTHGGKGLPDTVTIDQALAELNLPALDPRSTDTAQFDHLPMHQVPLLDAQRYKMIASIPPGSGASAWDTNLCPQCGPVDVGPDAATCSRCDGPLLRPVIQESDGSWRLIRGFRNSSYRRMAPDQPAATVTTASGHVGSDRTIHPWENRLLSPAECACLQTFPSDFKWGNALNKWGHTPVRKMIGEAVPPRFTELHGHVLAALHEGQELDMAIEQDDPRCAIAHAQLSK